MFRAAFIGWLIGKVVVGLVRGVMWLVEGAAYLVGAAGGLAVAAGRGWGSRRRPPV